MAISRAPSPISQGNVSGVSLVVFAIAVLMTAGFILYLAGLHPELNPELLKQSSWWRTYPPKAHVERWVLATVGAVFALAGLSMFITGVTEVNLKKSLKLSKRRNPQSPWLWDYDWKMGANLKRKSTPWWNHLIGVSILMGFHAVAWALAIKENFKGIVVIFPIGITLFTMLVAFIFWLNARRANAHKQVEITISSFPLRSDSSFKIFVQGLKPNLTKKLEVSLEAIEEIYSYEKNRSGVKTKILHEIEQTHLVNSDKLELYFELPDSNFVSQLSSRPARFWELHLYADCEGPNLDKRFFLPIY